MTFKGRWAIASVELHLLRGPEVLPPTDPVRLRQFHVAQLKISLGLFPIGSMYAIYMVTFTINIPPLSPFMLAYIPIHGSYGFRMLRQGSCAKWNQWSLPNQLWPGTNPAGRSAKCTLAKRKHWERHSMQVDTRTQRRSSRCREVAHHPGHQNPHHPNHPKAPQRPVDLPFTWLRTPLIPLMFRFPLQPKPNLRKTAVWKET